MHYVQVCLSNISTPPIPYNKSTCGIYKHIKFSHICGSLRSPSVDGRGGGGGSTCTCMYDGCTASSPITSHHFPYPPIVFYHLPSHPITSHRLPLPPISSHRFSGCEAHRVTVLVLILLGSLMVHIHPKQLRSYRNRDTSIWV